MSVIAVIKRAIICLRTYVFLNNLIINIIPRKLELNRITHGANVKFFIIMITIISNRCSAL